MFCHVLRNHSSMATRLNFVEVWTHEEEDGTVVPVQATFRGLGDLRAASCDEFLLKASQFVVERFLGLSKIPRISTMAIWLSLT